MILLSLFAICVIGQQVQLEKTTFGSSTIAVCESSKIANHNNDTCFTVDRCGEEAEWAVEKPSGTQTQAAVSLNKVGLSIQPTMQLWLSHGAVKTRTITNITLSKTNTLCNYPGEHWQKGVDVAGNICYDVYYASIPWRRAYLVGQSYATQLRRACGLRLSTLNSDERWLAGQATVRITEPIDLDGLTIEREINSVVRFRIQLDDTFVTTCTTEGCACTKGNCDAGFLCVASTCMAIPSHRAPLTLPPTTSTTSTSSTLSSSTTALSFDDDACVGPQGCLCNEFNRPCDLGLRCVARRCVAGVDAPGGLGPGVLVALIGGSCCCCCWCCWFLILWRRRKNKEEEEDDDADDEIEALLERTDADSSDGAAVPAHAESHHRRKNAKKATSKWPTQHDYVALPTGRRFKTALGPQDLRAQLARFRPQGVQLNDLTAPPPPRHHHRRHRNTKRHRKKRRTRSHSPTRSSAALLVSADSESSSGSPQAEPIGTTSSSKPRWRRHQQRPASAKNKSLLVGGRTRANTIV